MSIARLSAGAGYQYLLRHTACGDVPRDPSQSLTAYYTESGYPPGSWWGAGLDGLGDDEGRVPSGSMVTEEGMARLFGSGHDPATDAPLGRPYPSFRSTAERIEDAVAALPAGLADGQRALAVDVITRTESGRRTRSAVAGFDLTFSARKSVSVLWALSDPDTQARVVEAHRAAVRDTLALIQDRALFTRVGARSCAQVPTRGMIAAVFDHWDTRSGDPDLHSHVVIANKVQGLDGLWRSLDSRALHHAAVAVSEVYDNLLADRVAEVLPVGWSFRDRGPRRTPAFELDGIPDPLLAEFSTRSAAISAAMTSALVDFHARHGRAPTRVETTRLRQRLTLTTRPAKTVHRLPDLIAWWRQRAAILLASMPSHVWGPVLPTLAVLAEAAQARHHVRLLPGARPSPGHEGADAVRRLDDVGSKTRLWRRTAPGATRTWASAQVPDAVIMQLAATAVEAVMERRSTWTRWNLLAEAARATRPIRCSSPADRHALHDRVVAAALNQCVCLEAAEVFTAPAAFRRVDGLSVFNRPGQDVYSHRDILDAEARLLSALDDLTSPTADADVAGSVAGGLQPPRHPGGAEVRLAVDQVDAVTQIATSGRRVDVLVGPAGTGKTTTLRALRTVWEQRFGVGSVTGLAPSATAAAELADALGVECENTAKWLHESTGPAGTQRAEVLAGLRDHLAGAMRTGELSAARRVARAIAEVEQAGSRWALSPGQLLIVDEASLAGTLTLDTLAAQASGAGAKLLLVGDHQQLSAVDAGGAFALMATTPSAHELRSLWRFTQRWEAHATRRLRAGDPSVLSVYDNRERIRAGSGDEVLDAAYDAWAHDQARGASTLLLAAEADTVAALNDRAHQDRVATGVVDPSTEVSAADGTRAGAGDLVLTRRNDRRLITSAGQYVRNGDRWRITATYPDGSLSATRSSNSGKGEADAVRLPASYVREFVELGYATTIHRAQGVTVQAAHVLVTPAMSREALYVAMTRGSDRNHLYVPLDAPDENCVGVPDPGALQPTALELLAGVLAHSDRERSATETVRDREAASTAPSRLLPIRDTLLTGSPWNVDALEAPPGATSAEADAAIAEIDAVLHPHRVEPKARHSSMSARGRRRALEQIGVDGPERDASADHVGWEALGA